MSLSLFKSFPPLYWSGYEPSSLIGVAKDDGRREELEAWSTSPGMPSLPQNLPRLRWCSNSNTVGRSAASMHGSLGNRV